MGQGGRGETRGGDREGRGGKKGREREGGEGGEGGESEGECMVHAIN